MQQVWLFCQNYLGNSPVVSRSNVCLLTSLQLTCEYFPFLFLTTRAWYAAFCNRKIKFIMWILHLSGNVFLSASGNEMLCIHLRQTAAELNTKWQLHEAYSSLWRKIISILPLALWECMTKHKTQDLIHFINKRQEESTRTISNLLQRHQEQIATIQPIAVTVP